MIRNILRALALLALGGCVQIPVYVPLDAAVRASLKEIRVVSAIPQDEIYLSAASPGVAAAAGGGLLAAVIESQIAKSRQDAIQATIGPFYAAIDDIDFRKDYWKAVLPELGKLFPGAALEVKTTAAQMMLAERNKLVEALPAGKGLIYLSTRYSFTPDFSRLDVITSIDAWRGGRQASADRPEPAYSNVLFYQSAPVAATGNDAIRIWGRDEAKLYRAALAEGMAETTRMMRLDAEHARIKGVDQKMPGSTRSVEARKAAPGMAAVTGPVLEESPARWVIRNNDGRLHSLAR